MSKIKILGLTFGTACAVCAMFVAGASAEVTLLASWLNNGAMISTNLPSEINGELNLQVEGEETVACGVTLDGTVGVNGVDAVTAVLDASKETITNSLAGLALLCETVTLCEHSVEASPIEVWPIGIPWNSVLYLKENGSLADRMYAGTGTPRLVGYEILCLLAGIDFVNECTGGEINLPVKNNAAGDAEISVNSVSQPALNCTFGGLKGFIVAASATSIVINETGTLLSVSSE